MAIQEIILFISSVDEGSKPCVEFIMRSKMPVQIVRLDSQEAREQARHGKFFQITMVPTLVVIHSDRTIQLYVGPKALIFLASLLKRGAPPPPSEVVEDDESPTPRVIESDEDEDITPIHPPPKKLSKKKVVVPPPPPPKKKKGKKKSAEMEDVSGGNLEFVDDGTRPSRPPPLPTDGLRVGGKNAGGKKSAKSLVSLARAMEKERQATLGYNEEDLPRHL